MAYKREATLRSAWLGTALRKLREDSGLTGRQLAAKCGRHYGTISRIESGQQPARERDVQAFIEACGVSEPDTQARLFMVAGEVNERGWWDGYKSSVSGTLIDRLWLEERATSIRSFEAIVVPGLLQIPSYAEHLIKQDSPAASQDQIKRWLKIRMTRQHVLNRHDPVQFTCVIEEAVLFRVIASHAVMTQQLSHLLDISKRDNIDVRILRTKQGFATSGSFALLRLIDPFPLVAYAQTPMGDVCVEGTEAQELHTRFGSLMHLTLSARQSRKLIAQAKDEHDREAEVETK